jgi:glycerate kinase
MAAAPKVVACCDNFKGTATAVAAHAAIAAGLGERAVVDSVPMTDGGAGFLTALLAAREASGELEVVDVPGTIGPLQEPLESARYAFEPRNATAYIEMASSSGIELVPVADLDPLRATTFGFGQLIQHAITKKGAKRLCVGLGGSATNDGGAGLLAALGLVLATRRVGAGEADIRPVHPFPSGGTLMALEGVSGSDAVRSALLTADGTPVAIEIVSDVTNPLTGPTGATAVYGPQKGVRPELQQPLDDAMAVYGKLLGVAFGVEDVASQPGAGAAGGCGAALIALGGTMTAGAPRFASIVQLEERMLDADVIVTGEGSFDDQTLAYGKTVAVVAQCAKRASERRVAMSKSPVRVVVICGRRKGVSDAEVAAAGIHQVIALSDRFPVEVAMSKSAGCIQEIAAGLDVSSR